MTSDGFLPPQIPSLSLHVVGPCFQILLQPQGIHACLAARASPTWGGASALSRGRSLTVPGDRWRRGSDTRGHGSALPGAGTLPRLPDPGTHPSQQCWAHGCSERCPGWRKILPQLLPSALALDSLSRATLADHLPSATSCATRGGARRAGHATRAPDSPRHVRLWKSALRHPGRVRGIARPPCSRGLGRVNSP